METLSDFYELAADGSFPRLKWLDIFVNKSVIKTISAEVPAITNFHMPNLETLNLNLKRTYEANEEEKQIPWTTVETLTSCSVMPRLRRYTLIYTLWTNDEITQIFESSIFHNDERHIDFRFRFDIFTRTPMDSFYDITKINNIRFTNNQTIIQYVSFFILDRKINV